MRQVVVKKITIPVPQRFRGPHSLPLPRNPHISCPPYRCCGDFPRASCMSAELRTLSVALSGSPRFWLKCPPGEALETHLSTRPLQTLQGQPLSCHTGILNSLEQNSGTYPTLPAPFWAFLLFLEWPLTPHCQSSLLPLCHFVLPEVAQTQLLLSFLPIPTPKTTFQT